MTKTEGYTLGETVALKGNIPQTVWEFFFFFNSRFTEHQKNIKDNVLSKTKQARK